MASKAESGQRLGRRGSLARFLLMGGAGVAIVQITGVGAGMGVQMLLARLLTPELLAAFFLTQSVVEALAVVAHLGLPLPITRMLASAASRESAARARSILVAALPLAALGSAAISIAYALGAGRWIAETAFSSTAMVAGVAAATVWISAQVFQTVGAAALRGLNRVTQAAFCAGALNRLAMVAVLAAAVWTGASVELGDALWLAAATTGGAALIALISTGWIVRPGLPGSSVLRPLLAAALPLALTGLVYVVMNRVDLWTVGILLPAGDVAIYGAAKRLIAVTALPLTTLTLVIAPVVTELHQAGEHERLQRALRAGAALAGAPAVALLLLMAAAAAPILGLAYGDYYREGAPVLMLLCLERLAFVWVGPANLVLLMTGHEKTVMRITIAATLATVTATAIGASLAGLIGTATGFLLGSCVNHAAVWWAARRHAGVRTDIAPMALMDARATLDRIFRERQDP